MEKVALVVLLKLKSLITVFVYSFHKSILNIFLLKSSTFVQNSNSIQKCFMGNCLIQNIFLHTFTYKFLFPTEENTASKI